MQTQITQNHRTRVAAERRKQMRGRLVEAAMLVFAEKGLTSNFIQEVVAAAGVSQGTFYNYFRAHQDVLAEVKEELNNDLMLAVEERVRDIKDPALRVATGLRLYLHAARQHRVMAAFASEAGVQLAGPDSMIHLVLRPHLEEGVAMGVFAIESMDAMLDTIMGGMLIGMARMRIEQANQHPEKITGVLLRALGLSAKKTQTILEKPVAPLKLRDDSLVRRADDRYRK